MLKNNEVPKETNKNHVSVGRVGSDFSFAFYNPHNARFYFKFNKWNFKPDMLRFKTINSTELFIEFLDCRIVVKKNLIEICNKINTERRFTISGSLDDRSLAVKKAEEILENEVIVVLKEFIKSFGGSSDFVCVKRHIPDNKILHDKIVESIPVDVRFRNEVVKKVYNDIPINVEFSNPIYAANYFRNAGLFDFAPEIANQLKAISDERIEFSKALASYTEQINLHLKVEQRQLEVQDETLKTLKAIQKSSSHQTRGVSEDISHTQLSLNSLPSTLSRDSSAKDVKMAKVRYYLKEYGWGGSNWG